MIILKHHVAAKRNQLHRGEALARIRERTSQNVVATERAATWRVATKRLDQEREQIAWEMNEEQAQAQVQNIVLEKEARACLTVAKNRAKSARAEDRLRLIQHRKKVDKRELAVEIQVKQRVAAMHLAEREEQQMAYLDAEEERREAAHQQALQRKGSLLAAQERHFEEELAIGEERRTEGAELVALTRLASQTQLANSNKERFLRQRENLEDIKAAEEELRREEEVSLALQEQAVAERRDQKVLDLKATLAQRADAREVATEACQSRKDLLYEIAHQEKVEDVLAKDMLHEASVDMRRWELEERLQEKSRLSEEAHLSVRLRLEEEKEDGLLQAKVEMEEARAVLEDWGIGVNMVGLQVEALEDQTGASQLAMEDSLMLHEARASRLADKQEVLHDDSPRLKVTDAGTMQQIADGLQQWLRR